ncbi:hypothetical protein OBBRIDRAFT_735885, partial [Obba rivulosa]
VYTFFKPRPTIKYCAGRHCHIFHCLKGTTCMNPKGVNQFLDKADASLTSNLCKHIVKCFGQATLKTIESIKSAVDVHPHIKSYIWDGTIMTIFTYKGKGKIIYSTCPHTKAETRYVLSSCRLMSMQPFKIVEYCGLNCLIKTERPEYWLPSCQTLMCHVNVVYKHIKVRI